MGDSKAAVLQKVHPGMYEGRLVTSVTLELPTELGGSLTGRVVCSSQELLLANLMAFRNFLSLVSSDISWACELTVLLPIGGR